MGSPCWLKAREIVKQNSRSIVWLIQPIDSDNRKKFPMGSGSGAMSREVFTPSSKISNYQGERQQSCLGYRLLCFTSMPSGFRQFFSTPLVL
ncbi:hypothetical protein BJP36_28725 [Moorena producens JHB]|uniref:Uncharacterized protein n=1 Tax=Moorena producens (strain JHB) TaxID=1454205 RepID=A0A1D9G6N0_MOOP1|nr:hypothetical protein [Moorena producens]AOY83309.1 hypothetical protein BJP36_28725 [Moorena producens JHB]